MNKDTTFNYDKFIFASGNELHTYAGSLIIADAFSYSDSDYGRLLSGIPFMDSDHLVYAIELCMRIKPNDFLSHAIQLLANRDAAVCCAACRAIERLPEGMLTSADVNQIQAIPIVSLVTRHFRTGEETIIGTNEEFLQSILARAL